MWKSTISVVISFPKIRFEIEHYKWKSRLMHANEGNEWECMGYDFKLFSFFGGGGGSDIKRYGFPFSSHM